MFNWIKRIGLLTLLLVPSFAQAEEIQPEFFLHDFYNTTILFIGMDNGCGTVDQEMYQFIVKGAADYMMEEQDWDLDQAKSFLKAAAIQINQATSEFIYANGCDLFNFVVMEKKDDYKILNDALEIYSFEKPVDFI